jgi:hypothetical protein
MLYDPGGDRYLEVDKFTDGSGAAYIAGPDNSVLAFPGHTLIDQGTFQVSMTFIDPGDIVSVADLEVHMTAMGDYRSNRPSSPADLEEINGVSLAGVVGTSTSQECCRCYATLAEVATQMTASDPANRIWSVVGDLICTTSTDDLTGYGPIEFCDNQIFNVQAGANAPVFTAVPPTQCVTEAERLCATVSGGTVVGFRYRQAGTSTWTEIR